MNRMTQMPRRLFSTILLASVLGAATLPAAPSFAQAMPSEAVSRQTIHVPRDKSLSFRLPQNAFKIVVAQPEIAKVTPTTDSSFYVQGIEFGSTNLLVYGPSGRLQQVIDVRVGYDAEGLKQDLVAAFPGEPIEVRNLGESLMLTGDISSTGVQTSAEKIAERYAPDAVISRLTVKASQQVILEVRILEASRTAMQDIGVNLNVFSQSFAVLTGQGLLGVSSPAASITHRATAGSVTIDSQIQALEERGIVRTLARPTLVAVSGEKASFLAGGEFPFPVPDGRDRITVQFRQYGVKLNFLPVVRDNGWIRMLIEPEVSQLDPNNSLTVDGLTIPALSVRRANTTLELKPGDTFSMAGLYQRGYENAAQQTPWLADVPVLGALFRSARWKRDETELLILVTARLANAADRAAPMLDALPGREPTTKDLLLRGKTLDKSLPTSGPKASPGES